MLEQMFALRTRGATVGTEVLGGATTFMVMAYIIFVNPAILSFAGVPGLAGEGPGFAQTLAATCLVAGILTALMSLVPCNCLQSLENAMDPVRTACLHTQAYL